MKSSRVSPRRIIYPPNCALPSTFLAGLKKVTVLDGDVFDGAFMNMRTLTEVVFADDADTTYIGEAAFMGATALEGFTVPAGVSIVGDYAFCFSGVRTVDMSAADEITVLPEYIFGENTRLATISLPENLVTIEGYAFYMASALKNIVIPDSVTTIGEYAFYACTSLESVSCPPISKRWAQARFHAACRLKAWKSTNQTRISSPMTEFCTAATMSWLT